MLLVQVELGRYEADEVGVVPLFLIILKLLWTVAVVKYCEVVSVVLGFRPLNSLYWLLLLHN